LLSHIFELIFSNILSFNFYDNLCQFKQREHMERNKANKEENLS